MAQMITETAETELSRRHAQSLGKINPALSMLDPDQVRPTEYYVGVYSVNKRRMADSPFAFVVENAVLKTIGILPCPMDKRYVKVLEIAHPTQWVELDPNAAEPDASIVRVQSGKRVAMSIVHPDVVGESMDHLPPQSTLARVAISSNCDLIKQGVFFTTEEEGSPKFNKLLEAAEKRLESYYRGLLDGTHGMSEEEVRRLLGGQNGLDLRMAAEHFGEEYSWMKRRVPKVDCPYCFEKIPQGAAFHKSELLGSLCVIDWERAVEAGVKKREDVPEGKRWWTDAPPAAAPEGGKAADGASATRTELEGLSRPELFAFAKEFGVAVQATWTNKEIIAELETKTRA